MTVRLSTAQAFLVGRIDKFAQGSRIRTYMPTPAEMRTIAVLEREGYCQYRARGEPDVEYNGYALTDKGREFVSSRRG